MVFRFLESFKTLRESLRESYPHQKEENAHFLLHKD